MIVQFMKMFSHQFLVKLEYKFKIQISKYLRFFEKMYEVFFFLI